MMMEGLPPKVSGVALPGGDGAGAGAEGDLCGADGERVETEFVGEDDADGGAADGDVDDLAKGGAVGSGGAELCRRDFWRPWETLPRCRPSDRGCAAVAMIEVRQSRSRSSRRENLLDFVVMTVLIAIGLTAPSYRCFVEAGVSRIVARADGMREIPQ